MHVDFDPHIMDWSYFTTISGGGDGQMCGGGGQALMGGGGVGASYPVFSGMPFQRGAGIGAVLRSLWRVLLPVGKEIGGAIGRQGLETGSRVLSGLLDGQDVKETLVSEGKSGLKNLLDKAANNLNKQKGSGNNNFDFKRYKRVAAATAGKESDVVDEHIKRRLLSTLGPSTLPQVKKKKRKSVGTKTPRKKAAAATFPPLKVDALGPY
jgi:hypothetical protein